MKTILRWSILSILISFNSFAQQPDSLPPGNVWTLKQCIDYALTNNLNVQRGIYNVESSEIDYDQSKVARYPNLNAGLSYNYNWGRSVDPVTYSYTTEQQKTINPNASTSMTLFNGMRIQHSIKQYQRSYEASQQDLQKTKNDVMLSIASLYITVVFNKEQLENAKFQLSSTQQQLDRTRKQVAAGALPRSNELNLDAQVATNEVNVINRENALNQSLLQLKQALQLPASTPFEVEVPQIDVVDLVLDQSRDQIYDIAKQTMPEIRSANLKIESSDYAVKAAKGNFYPRLSLNGYISTNYSSASDRRRFVSDGGEPAVTYPQIGEVDVNGTSYDVISSSPVLVPSGSIKDSYNVQDQLKDNVFRQVGVSLSIPIFNNYQSRAAWQRSVINQKLADISAKETSNTLRQSVETAYNDAVAASKTYNSSLRQVQARDEAYRMTKQRFEAGAANYVEYQVSENDLFQAKSDLVRAKYDFIFKKKVLDFYQGIPLGY